MGAKDQAFALRDAVAERVGATGEKSLTEFENASLLLLSWLDYFRVTQSRAVSDELLASCHASMIEAAACLALGLVRSSIYAIRLEIEAFLAWAYFNDHPVEWRSTIAGDSDFPMRKQNLVYLEKYNPGFAKRLALLKAHSERNEKDPYSLLSKFVHGSSLETMPAFNKLTAVVETAAAVDACVRLQSDVCEYLSDLAASWLAFKWHDFPSAIKADITGRLTASQLKDFTR
jgi:hypothetical protein